MAKKDFDIPVLLHRLERLHEQAKLEEAMALMLQPWPGMEADIRTIVHEMIYEARKTGNAPMFLKSAEFEEDRMTVSFPDWFSSAYEEFQKQYEKDEAELRFRKALTTLQDRLFTYLEGSSDTVSCIIKEALEESLSRTKPRWGRA